MCPRRSSRRSTARSAARPPSTCRRARTSLEPSTSRPRSSPHFRPLERERIPPARAERIERPLTTLGLAPQPLPYPLATVHAALGADKKHSAGRLHWVLPTAEGVAVDADVPAEIVDRVAAGLLSTGGAA